MNETFGCIDASGTRIVIRPVVYVTRTVGSTQKSAAIRYAVIAHRSPITRRQCTRDPVRMHHFDPPRPFGGALLNRFLPPFPVLGAILLGAGLSSLVRACA